MHGEGQNSFVIVSIRHSYHYVYVIALPLFPAPGWGGCLCFCLWGSLRLLLWTEANDWFGWKMSGERQDSLYFSNSFDPIHTGKHILNHFARKRVLILNLQKHWDVIALNQDNSTLYKHSSQCQCSHGQTELCTEESLLACNTDAELMAPGSFLMVRGALCLERYCKDVSPTHLHSRGFHMWRMHCRAGSQVSWGALLAKGKAHFSTCTSSQISLCLWQCLGSVPQQTSSEISNLTNIVIW